MGGRSGEIGQACWPLRRSYMAWKVHKLDNAARAQGRRETRVGAMPGKREVGPTSLRMRRLRSHT